MQNCKKGLNDQDNHSSVVTHLEPDSLVCEVKWAIGSITMNKASGGDRIPVELFQILEDAAAKVLHSKCQQIWKIQQWPQDLKRLVFIPIPKKGNAKWCLTVWITTSCGKLLNGNTRPPYLPPEKPMQVKKQQLEPDMEQRTGSKLGKEHVKAVYCHPVYLTSIQSTSCEMPGWMNHKLQSRFPGEISITSDMQVLLLSHFSRVWLCATP